MNIIYGDRSRQVFSEIHPDLQKICLYIRDTLKIDHSLICGFRSEEEQMAAYNATPQRSKLKWPESLHNQKPSIAVDVVPYVRLDSASGGIHWHHEDPKIREFYIREMIRFATTFQMVGLLVFGLNTRWGGDWDRDWYLLDNKFNDYPHIELVR